MSLPTLLECNMMPEDHNEIPTPGIAQYFSHLKPMADKIPPYDANAPILLLFGRDILSMHKVREQYNGPGNMSYAQHLELGHCGRSVYGRSTQVRDCNFFSGQTYCKMDGHIFFPPCSKGMQVKEQFGTLNDQYQSSLHSQAVLRITWVTESFRGLLRITSFHCLLRISSSLRL